jgi:predicted amidohydrolase YtcJ
MMIHLLCTLLLAAPDLVVAHATLPSVPGADAVAIEKGRFSAVGKTADIEKLTKKGTRFLDARGRLVLPGLIDSHVHFASGGINMKNVDLNGATASSTSRFWIRPTRPASPSSASSPRWSRFTPRCPIIPARAFGR